MTAPPRRGLVLGGGGILGAAWMLGALESLAEMRGVDPRTCRPIVGTSAGSFLAALIGAGCGVTDLFDHQLGNRPAPRRTRPPRRGLRPAAPGLLADTAARRRRADARVMLAAALPEGRHGLDQVTAMIDQVIAPDRWCAHPDVRITGFDLEAGARVLFGPGGRPGVGRPPPQPGPSVALRAAVHASCAIPGWFRPLVVDGRRYVDGGVASVTNADLVAAAEVDEVYVLAPMASEVPDRPRSAGARLERAWRRRSTRALADELAILRTSGVGLTVLTPGPEDLAAMGANLMDAHRREAVLATSRRTSRHALRARPARR